MTGPPPSSLTRRGALGGALVAFSAAGCELDQPSGSRPSTTPTPSPTEAEPVTPDPDADLVDDVVEELAGLLALVSGAARARPGLVAELAPWRRMHLAHLAALESRARGRRPERVRGSAEAIRTQVRRRESAGGRRLAGWALEARSGPLAALLATMSAAVAQQLAATAGRRGR